VLVWSGVLLQSNKPPMECHYSFMCEVNVLFPFLKGL